MTFCRYIMIVFTVIILSSVGKLAAQTVTVKGVLRDAQLKSVVAGVTVSTDDKTTSTDNNGQFTIEAKVGSQITFTHVNYVEKKWKVTEALPDVIEILLEPRDKAMEQVVVQSFKQVKKSTVTGASTVISGKDLQDQPTANVMELIQGKVAGFNVQMTTGSPGAAPTMNLRGVSTTNVTSSGNLSPTSPLFIVDGVPVDVNTNYQYGFESGGAGISPLSLIPPEDIESVEVLKDAAMTSQYGSKATYGVVVITTKRGQSKVPIISYTGSYFYTTPPKLRETIGGQLERNIRINTILNFDTASRAASLALISQIPFLSDSLNPYYNNSTDWQSYFYRSTGNQQHNINITGGDRRFNYKANLNYFDQKGIVVNTGLQRYTLNLLGTYNPTDKFSMTINLQQDIAYKQNASGVGALQTGIAKTANTSSTLPSPSLFSNAEALEAANAKNDGKLNSTTGSLNIGYEPIRGVRLTNLLTYNYASNTNDYLRSAYLAQDSAGLFAYNDRAYNLYNRTQISFTKIAKEVHTFQAYAFNEITKEGFRANMIYFNQPADAQISGPIGNNYGTSAGGTLSNISEGRIHAYGGDFSYDYKEKYIIDAAFRLDNTSTNGPSRGYTKSPAISARWNFYKENFLEKASSWLSSGDFRFSWGRNIKPNGSIYDVYGKYIYGPKYNDGQTVMIDFTTLPNVQFEPEVAATTNLGLDLGFLNNRISFTADAYYKAIDNQIVKTDLSNTNGFTRVSLNAQSIVNRGIEVATNFNIIQKSDVRWSVNMNGAWNEAVLTHLPNGLRSITTTVQDAYGATVPVINQLGSIPISNLLYVTQGVYANTSDVPVNPATGLRLQYGRGQGLYFQAGDPIWADINGDYIIDNSANSADVVAVGNPIPKLTGGFGTQLVYKALTLNISTSLTAYRDILNLVLADQFANYTDPTSASALIPIDGYNYWKPTTADRSEGTVGAVYPNPYDFRRAGALQPFRVNQTLYLENGTYFKINSVILSYNVDRNLLRRYGLNSLRLSLSGTNLYTFTKYSGTSPEQVSSLGRDISGGYPLARTYSFTLNVQF